MHTAVSRQGCLGTHFTIGPASGRRGESFASLVSGESFPLSLNSYEKVEGTVSSRSQSRVHVTLIEWHRAWSSEVTDSRQIASSGAGVIGEPSRGYRREIAGAIGCEGTKRG
jgi:hypothetical protein